MFIHYINPTLVHLGPLQIRYYGLVYVFGFLFLYYILKKAAERKIIANLTPSKAENLMIWLVIALIVGARFFHVFVYEFSYYKDHLLDALKIWNGGLSFHGGMVGLLVAAFIYCRKNKIKFYDVADTVAIPISLVLFLGRIANFVNGELWGKVTSVKWCVDFSKNPYLADAPEGCRHPSQLYEAGKNLFNFFLLFFLNGRSLINKKLYKPGTMFWLFVACYGILRFLATFYREEAIVFAGLSEGQLLSLLMGITGLVFLFITNKTFIKKTIRKRTR